jgi:predicted nucleic acid-binding protein
MCLIDTDILINILKRREPAYQQSLEYLKQHKKFSISCLTYYECLRGYQAIGATRRLKVFRKLLNITEVLYLDQAILDKAGEIYGVLRKKGLLPGEFDILIGATALIHNFTLSTNNEKHYEKMQEHFQLRINNWLKEI